MKFDFQIDKPQSHIRFAFSHFEYIWNDKIQFCGWLTTNSLALRQWTAHFWPKTSKENWYISSKSSKLIATWDGIVFDWIDDEVSNKVANEYNIYVIVALSSVVVKHSIIHLEWIELFLAKQYQSQTIDSLWLVCSLWQYFSQIFGPLELRNIYIPCATCFIASQHKNLIGLFSMFIVGMSDLFSSVLQVLICKCYFTTAYLPCAICV